MSIKDIEAKVLIDRVKEHLKKFEELKPPEWSVYVKTGVNRERPPLQQDWWYMRMASIMRKLYLSPEGIGVQRLRTLYGGRKNRGHKPEHKYKASGNIIRKMLQQLETIGFLETKKGKGRILTKKGKEFISNIAKQIK